jgi:uncharacterized protein
MAQHLPELIDPLSLADKRSQFKGSLPLSKMTRMQDILLNPEGVVSFELRFGKDGTFAVVTGIVEAKLELQCQCCLEPIAWPVSSRVNLAIVSSLVQANLLPEAYEPLLLEAQALSLTDIIQEELLLAVPSIPQHRRCEASPAREVKPPSAMPGRPNPFAVLAKLKK